MVSPQIHVVVVGPGLVGSALLVQLTSELDHVFTVIAVANSTHVVTDPESVRRVCEAAVHATGSGPDAVRRAMKTYGTAYPAGTLLGHLPRDPRATVVVVDCTASRALPAGYPALLAAGLRVVTANKQGLAGPLDLFAAMAPALFRTVFGESTVGAGLPVLATLRDLVETGDAPTRIDAVLSGSLSFLFNRIAPADAKAAVIDVGGSFAEGVRAAMQLGFTEPDPRDDLDGLDVARKLVILARTCGWLLSLDDVAVQSLVPAAFAALPLPAFLARLDDLDAGLAQHLARTPPGTVIRYVGVLDLVERRASVGVQVYPTTHPFAHLASSDNCVQFTTPRFPRGLTLQGAGAGDQVTVFGITADLFKIYRQCVV